jgi:hypothetical protein
VGGGHSQNTRLESTITLSYAPYFENAPHPMSLHYASDTPGRLILGTNTNYLTLYPKFVARLAGEQCFFFQFPDGVKVASIHPYADLDSTGNIISRNSYNCSQ